MSYAIIGFGKIGHSLAKAFARNGIEASYFWQAMMMTLQWRLANSPEGSVSRRSNLAGSQKVACSCMLAEIAGGA